jgi:aspartyl protease family protein
MAIDRLIRTVVVLAGVSIAVPFVAPDLLAYVVVWQGRNLPAFDSPRGNPLAVAVAKPAASATSTAPQGRSVTLRADSLGGFQANAMINGHSVRVVVDTGATTVAMSSETARRLGVLTQRSDYRLTLSTANGTVEAAPVMLTDVRIGDILVRNVQAVVIPGEALGTTLLGMSFLSRLHKFEISRGQLVLSE